MSIEKSTGSKNYYVYRINPYQPCEIDRKRNTRYARWERMPDGAYDTPAAARIAWLELNKTAATEAKGK